VGATSDDSDVGASARFSAKNAQVFVLRQHNFCYSRWKFRPSTLLFAAYAAGVFVSFDCSALCSLRPIFRRQAQQICVAAFAITTGPVGWAAGWRRF
jgi:hypothetical protein